MVEQIISIRHYNRTGLLTTLNLFQITYLLEGCSKFVLSTTVTGRTGYGVPDPVTSAYVNDSSNQCVVVWKHDSSVKEIDYFQVD